MIEHFAAVFGYDDQVLDPHTNRIRQINTGLDGKAHAGNQRHVVGGTDVRPLMNLNADIMAGAVGKLLAVTRFGNDIPRRRIHIAGL